jgi:hypothetical protein
VKVNKTIEDSPLGIMERKTRVNVNVCAGYHNTPSIRYMLVSLRALDNLGYWMLIGGGHLEICSQAEKCLTCMAKTVCGLYHMSYNEDEALAVEVVSMMELHQHMGHIAPTSVHKLI